MVRGLIRPTTGSEAIQRLKSLVGLRLPPPKGITAPTQPIAYRLNENSGGKNPNAPHPADWSGDIGWKRWTSDCVGTVVWGLGFDRYQKASFKVYGGWINTDSMLQEAEKYRTWFEVIDTPELACLVVTPGVFATNGARLKAGHVGLVSGLPAEWDTETPDYGALSVVHCSSGQYKKTGAAIAETNGLPWAKATTKFLRCLKIH